MKNTWFPLAAACALVVGVYAYTAQSGVLELRSPNAADTYYNLLVRGFRDGHLSLKKEVPPALVQLADPYDPIANARYRYPPYNLYDLSYYRGKLYLYWGVTPALILFWPYVTFTGHYLFHRQAVVIFCTLGFLASAVLLRALWQRYFTEVNVAVVMACTLALGLATFVPSMLSRCDVYEVPIGCGYMLTMLTLGAIWCSLHEPERRIRWLAMASMAYGLAVGARPSLLFGSVILLVPVAQAWRERRPIGTLLAAATGPIVLIGLGLMLYNARRFDNPLEFGQRYQLSADRQDIAQRFSLHYLWFNFRVCFLEPARWSAHFPYVQEIAVPPLPAGYGRVETPFGILTNIPLVWLALAAPLAWRKRLPEASSILRCFLTVVALLFWICAMTVGFFFFVCIRYEVDFLPALMLLAVVGILGVERALDDQPFWRCTVRWGWGLLLGFSVVFNLLASVGHYAETDQDMGVALMDAGKVQEAIKHLEQALRINPDYAVAHNSLGVALEQAGRTEEAIEHFEQALRINPDHAGAHYNLGYALQQTGRLQDAIGHYKQALQIRPNFADAHYELGNALFQEGKIGDAIGHYEQALQIKPDNADAHYNLGVALEQTGKIKEAIEHYKQALQINPDLSLARTALERLQLGQ
jgi:Flp pilus assembly protein TadD